MSDGWIGGLIGAVCLILLAGAVWLALHEAHAWETFRAAHQCRKIGTMRGDVVTSFGPVVGGQGGVGVMVGTTPDKTGWLCDDGLTYWR